MQKAGLGGSSRGLFFRFHFKLVQIRKARQCRWKQKKYKKNYKKNVECLFFHFFEPLSTQGYPWDNECIQKYQPIWSSRLARQREHFSYFLRICSQIFTISTYVIFSIKISENLQKLFVNSETLQKLITE